jgi:hypothetical protein
MSRLPNYCIIECDTCHRRGGGDHAGTEVQRRALAKVGWVSRVFGRDAEDLCPECAKSAPIIGSGEMFSVIFKPRPSVYGDTVRHQVPGSPYEFRQLAKLKSRAKTKGTLR